MTRMISFGIALLLVGLAMLGAASALAATGMQSTHYRIPWSEFSAGGGKMESQHYRIQGSLAAGMPAAAPGAPLALESGQNRIQTGFWVGVSQVYSSQARLFLPLIRSNR